MIKIFTKKISGSVLLFLTSFSILFLFLLFRDTGIHVDENNYLDYANRFALGDWSWTGKPFLFYAFNYYLNHALRFFLSAHISVEILYFGYIVLSIVPLMLLANREKVRKQKWIFIISLSLLPFVVLNSTQIMMESFIIPLISFLYFFIVRSRNNFTPGNSFGLFFFSFASVAAKETSLFPVFLFVICYFDYMKTRVVYVIVGAILGISFAYYFKSMIHVESLVKYSDIYNFLRADQLSERLRHLPGYLYAFIFFTFPFYIPAISYGLRQKGIKEGMRIAMILFLTMGAVIFIEILSIYNYVRYAYPVIWSCILCLSFHTVLKNRSEYILFAFISIFFSFSLVSTYSGNSRLWPEVIQTELFYNGGTIMPGASIHRWNLLRNKVGSKCVIIAKKGTEHPELIPLYLNSIAESIAYIGEEGWTDTGNNCPVDQMVILRTHEKSIPDNFCHSEKYSQISMVEQPMKYWYWNVDPVYNLTCLP
ncbi:MAG: hypothetical protein K8R21_03655 [Leptospira sp.]|nr:hypothetical protein [Leptospira sp.]